LFDVEPFLELIFHAYFILPYLCVALILSSLARVLTSL